MARNVPGRPFRTNLSKSRRGDFRVRGHLRAIQEQGRRRMGLKTRIIPVLLYDEYGCVKGRQFNPGRRIGSVKDRIALLERRDIDELILLDINASRGAKRPRSAEIAAYCERLFCPITVGGGVTGVDDFRLLLAVGADKVATGTGALENPQLIEGAATRFGAQAVVVSIDVKEKKVWSHCGQKNTGRSPVEWASECESRGAGELLLTSIEQDGTLTGYDLDLILEVSRAVSIPVIACGGCGTYEHMAKALNMGAHAVAAGAMFQFRDATPKAAARYLHDHGIPTRL